MTILTLQDDMLDVLRRAHPRPLSAAAIAGHLDREGGRARADTRTVRRALESLRGQGLVRRMSTSDGVAATYALVTDTCPACGGFIGSGGTCGRCGEAT